MFRYGSYPITDTGFPHSDIHGSRLAYSSPWRFGVRSVLLRLLAPRHPPYALISLTIVGLLLFLLIYLQVYKLRTCFCFQLVVFHFVFQLGGQLFFNRCLFDLGCVVVMVQEKYT